MDTAQVPPHHMLPEDSLCYQDEAWLALWPEAICFWWSLGGAALCDSGLLEKLLNSLNLPFCLLFYFQPLSVIGWACHPTSSGALGICRQRKAHFLCNPKEATILVWVVGLAVAWNPSTCQGWTFGGAEQGLLKGILVTVCIYWPVCFLPFLDL